MKEDLEKVFDILRSHSIKVKKDPYHDIDKEYTYYSIYTEEDDDEEGDTYKHFFTIKLFSDCGFIWNNSSDEYRFKDLISLIKPLEVFLNKKELEPKGLWDDIIMELYTL